MHGLPEFGKFRRNDKEALNLIFCKPVLYLADCHYEVQIHRFACAYIVKTHDAQGDSENQSWHMRICLNEV
jgi:hypothetical protein